ncbi:MAG TPA: ferritin family protein [Anaeromyxobacteraceae bacterium]|nr:ferritin family protein [Anaeromyxobacteraceae bacterium]
MPQKIDFAKLSLKDALDLAILIEDEAKERYEEFTKVVGGRYKGDAADVFRTMVGYEARHGAALAERRKKIFGNAPSAVSADALDDAEAPDRGAPRVYMSARQAMEVALKSEEKAFDYFDSALKFVKDPDVKKLFEELRAEEVQHQEYIKKALASLPPGPDVEEADADEPGSDAG